MRWLFTLACVMIMLMPGILGDVAPLRNLRDMSMHCSMPNPLRNLRHMSMYCTPAGAFLTEALLCRWEPRFKNDSNLETWLATHVWTVYIVLSLVLVFELLSSSYLSGALFNHDEDDDFEDLPDEDR